jgi:perosamine synthetase
LRSLNQLDSQLALDDGTPVREAPFPARMLYGAEEKAAVAAVMDRAAEDGQPGYGGEQEEAYCEAFFRFQGGGFADGVNSGTNAVYVALPALELPEGSEVVVPPFSDPGGVMPVALCGLVPRAADCEPNLFNTDASQIEAALTDRTSAILVAHIAGLPVHMGPILELASSRGLRVIEDCAQAHGATYRGRRVGTLGDIAAFSTMGGKHHSTGGQGGVLYSRHEDLIRKARRYADRGKPIGLDGETQNVVASLNCNMDELHAAIGCAQLKKLPSIIERRRRLALDLARRIETECRSVRLVTEPPGVESVFWFLFVGFDPEQLAADRTRFAAALQAEGIPAATYWHAPVLMKWMATTPMTRDLYPPQLPNTHRSDATHIRIVFHEDWTEREIDDVVAAVRKVERAWAV